MSSSRLKPTFAERLSFDQKIEAEDFDQFLLRRCLHVPLRWVYPALKFMLSNYLEPDLKCVRATSNLRSNRDLENELAEFSYHPSNRHFVRRILRQRLSTHKTYRLLRQLPRGR